MNVRLTSDATASLVMLEPLERRVIVYLRLLRSATGRREVEHDRVARAGPGSEGSLDHLQRLESLMARAVDRPLDIGSIEDARATEDEMVLAQLIAAAADTIAPPSAGFGLRVSPTAPIPSRWRGRPSWPPA
jgi:hypothetical protein